MDSFPYPIPKTGKTITDQSDLICDLTIALGLIERGSTIQRETGAKIMLNLMNSPIESPANRIDAYTQAKLHIQPTSEILTTSDG